MRDISLSYIDGATLSGADAVLEQYEIALFTGQSEFGAEPTFGIGLETFIGEQMTETNAKAIRSIVVARTERDFPEIKINSIQILKQSFNQFTIMLDVIVVPYGDRKTITKDFTNG